MKKKLLALAMAAVLSMSMGMTALASGSVSTPAVEQSAQPSESLSTEVQELSMAAVVEMAETTVVESTDVPGVTITTVTQAVAESAVAQARAVVGDNAFIATIVDLNVPAGTGTASFTLRCPNVWAGQSVTILHQRSNGEWETIIPTAVRDNEVDFTLTSYSAIAVVIDTTAPKTSDVAPFVAVMAFICLAGVVVFSRKKAI